MTTTNSILLHVGNIPDSITFYRRLLGQEPIEASPTFAMFLLPGGLALGLWRRDGVEPASAGAAGSSELGFHVSDAAQVDARHAEWQAAGARIVMAPRDLDFGRSFVAADPDGHRLRVYTVTDM